MTILQSLSRQHRDIEIIMKNIEENIQKNPIENYVRDIVKQISHLSGVLTIHLRQEDEFIYPNLMNSNNEDSRQITSVYLKEMQGIADSLTQYKSKYNTSRKILNQLEEFKEETSTLFSTLRQRIKKEDNQLYSFLGKLGESDLIKIAIVKVEDKSNNKF